MKETRNKQHLNTLPGKWAAGFRIYGHSPGTSQNRRWKPFSVSINGQVIEDDISNTYDPYDRTKCGGNVSGKIGDAPRYKTSQIDE